MPENSSQISAPGAYRSLRIASRVALSAIVIAIAWAALQAITNWSVIRV